MDARRREPPFALFDDATCGERRGSRLLTGLVASIEAHDADGFERVLAAVDEARRAGHAVALALAYELGHALAPRAGPRAPREGEPLARALVFRDVTELRADEAASWLDARIAELSPDQRAAGVCDVFAEVDRAAYVAAVEKIRGYVAAGDCYQVNFTFALRMRAFGAPLALYAALRRRQPVAHAALVAPGDGTHVLSLSPELFVQRTGSTLRARPMKGTAARSPDPALDGRARDDLAASAKDRAENVMIVDLLRNDLGRIATRGSVVTPSLFDVETYPTLHQLTSRIEAEAPAATIGDVVRAMFPCGSVTGAPKLRAMQIAAELERSPRGVYTGALGWVAPRGDFSWNVAIRTLEIAADGEATLGVGSGIVADSVAEAEHDECLLKARFLVGLDPGFSLVETMRLERSADGTGTIALVEAHLARLAASAASLGFRCDRAAIRASLDALADEARPRAARVRLTLSHDGAFAIERGDLDELAPGARRVALSPIRVCASDPLRRHKTTVRATYDAELRRACSLDSGFDAIFLNEHGRVAEGARSNVWIEMDGAWITPPLSEGALPGVMRAAMLDDASRTTREAPLGLEELRAADAIHVSNALRGLVRVTLDETSLADAE